MTYQWFLTQVGFTLNQGKQALKHSPAEVHNHVRVTQTMCGGDTMGPDHGYQYILPLFCQAINATESLAEFQVFFVIMILKSVLDLSFADKIDYLSKRINWLVSIRLFNKSYFLWNS